jgi:hypothetical protein
VLAEMRKFAEPFNTKWDGKTGHYFIYIDINTNELIVITTYLLGITSSILVPAKEQKSASKLLARTESRSII